ncbi:MAG TPA: copper resistance CopC family protein [Herbaspirillum sp.]|jgi:copper transport protein
MRSLLFVLLQGAAVAAFAQAALLETMPADDAVLQHAPAELTLRFNQAVTPLVFKLLLPDGSVQQVQVQRAGGQDARDSLRIGLPLSMVQGTYLLSWKVAAGNGKASGGAVSYSLGFRSDICVVNPGTGTGSVSLGPPPGR